MALPPSRPALAPHTPQCRGASIVSGLYKERKGEPTPPGPGVRCRVGLATRHRCEGHRWGSGVRRGCVMCKRDCDCGDCALLAGCSTAFFIAQLGQRIRAPLEAVADGQRKLAFASMAGPQAAEAFEFVVEEILKERVVGDAGCHAWAFGEGSDEHGAGQHAITAVIAPLLRDVIAGGESTPDEIELGVEDRHVLGMFAIH